MIKLVMQFAVGGVLLAVAASTIAQSTVTPKQAVAFGAKAKAAFVDGLKDPGSAKLRGLYVSRGRRPVEEGLPVVIALCGQVNAKNSYGGYTGFHEFYYVDAGTNDIDGQSSTSGFTAWQLFYCSDKVADLK